MTVVRGIPALPVDVNLAGQAEMTSGNTSASSAWTTLVQPNPERKMGVWIQCKSTTENAVMLARKTGSTASGFRIKASYRNTTTAANFDVFFFPGQSGVEVKDEAESAALPWVAMEY